MIYKGKTMKWKCFLLLLLLLGCTTAAFNRKNALIAASRTKNERVHNNKTTLTTTLPTEDAVIEIPYKRQPRVLTSVALISFFNILCNLFRPDPDLGLVVSL
jgi:hypothetical protein